ncbi:MAG TPA: response regulator [Opitutaceae bacterium]|jgi:CheY-like chemotaxis protein|nr:response regulator [Opitutaceae bacterium]
MSIEENKPAGFPPAAKRPSDNVAAKKAGASRPLPANLIRIDGTTLPENFAHDLNNCIAIINGYSEVCMAYLSNGHNDEKLHKYLTAIHDATQQAADFTRQLLVLSHRKKTSTTPTTAFNGFPQGSESILVIEDEEVLRNMLRTVLEQHGYQTTFASTGEQATKIFAASPEAFDLILLDLQLPDMSGLVVLHRIKQMRPRQKAIAVSGCTDAEIDEALERFGVRDHLIKPYHLNELGRKLREVISRIS